MLKSTTVDRTARAKSLVAAAHRAREEWLTAPKGSIERKALALRALNAIYIAQDAVGDVLDDSEDEVADDVAHI